ncbi:MAG: type IV pilus biogenesis protein PilP [Proteobacteria bacterium]|jgi:type IV pilus biogenesis protein PilP|nr:type IV pilus biogenesis protein PilP [Alphaproteobacteria bacterium]NCC03968.1 type IV pilus biogenesis protein PilP [Pseudomonadota bacterium]
MKIAARARNALSILALLGVAIPSASAQTGENSVAGASAPAAVQAPAPANSALAPSVNETLHAIKVPETAVASQGNIASNKGVGIDEEVVDEDPLAPTPEIPDSVKGVVKSLNHATKDVTLEDLNSAREAVAKLDVLIDIEKRLNDLVSLRKEREEKVDAFAGALPASALGVPSPGVVLPTPTAPMPSPVMAPAPSPMPVTSSFMNDPEVTRISGASGRYVALIKDTDGTERQVQVGDTLADGSSVKAISRNGVTLSSGSGKQGDSKKRTVGVKDVATVFNGR